jgi:hypothetical protein
LIQINAKVSPRYPEEVRREFDGFAAQYARARVDLLPNIGLAARARGKEV